MCWNTSFHQHSSYPTVKIILFYKNCSTFGANGSGSAFSSTNSTLVSWCELIHYARPYELHLTVETAACKVNDVSYCITLETFTISVLHHSPSPCRTMFCPADGATPSSAPGKKGETTVNQQWTNLVSAVHVYWQHTRTHTHSHKQQNVDPLITYLSSPLAPRTHGVSRDVAVTCENIFRTHHLSWRFCGTSTARHSTGTAQAAAVKLAIQVTLHLKSKT